MQLYMKFLPAIIQGQAVVSSFFMRMNIGLPIQLFAKQEIPPYLVYLNFSFQPDKVEIKSLEIKLPGYC